MSDNMAEKYQQYYNKLLNGTLTDTIIKSISYQANIQLANDIIAEQEKTIQELEISLKDLKNQLEDIKVGKNNSENSKIVELENQVKANASIISRLQSDLNESNRLKIEYENIKHQATHVDTFRNELIKERESHKKTRDEYEQKINDLNNSYTLQLKELNDRIDYLQLTPAKRKKIDEVNNKKVEVVEEIISTLPLESEVRDGGSF
jgi:chromosome segregation ATPase